MRKLDLAIIALSLGLSVAACKTEYACKCVTNDPNGSTTDTYVKKHSNKSEAKSWCAGYEKKSSKSTTDCRVSER